MPESTLKAVPIETAAKQSEMPTRYPKGRRCSCGAPLSVWNAGPSCYACEKALADLRAERPLMLDEPW